MVAKYYFQQRPTESNRTRRYKFRNKKKRKFRWIGHTLRKEDGEIPKGCPTLEPSGKQEERKTEKQLEKIGNQGSG